VLVRTLGHGGRLPETHLSVFHRLQITFIGCLWLVRKYSACNQLLRYNVGENRFALFVVANEKLLYEIFDKNCLAGLPFDGYQLLSKVQI